MTCHWLTTVLAVVVAVVAVVPCTAGAQSVPGNDPALLTARVMTTEKRPSALMPLYVSLAALQVTDGVATEWGVNHGRIESNPAFMPFANTPAALWAVKGGVTAGAIYLSERLWRHGHRGEAIATMVVSNGILIGVTARNASVLRTTP
jgi:Domain of unknown function (DUF5658)